MTYGRILFNNIKEYTPSWFRTIPYSQITREALGMPIKYAKTIWKPGLFSSVVASSLIAFYPFEKIGRKPQVVSRTMADPKVKSFYRFFQRNIQKNAISYQLFIFGGTQPFKIGWPVHSFVWAEFQSPLCTRNWFSGHGTPFTPRTTRQYDFKWLQWSNV